jgi:hypothetical protein
MINNSRPGKPPFQVGSEARLEAKWNGQGPASEAREAEFGVAGTPAVRLHTPAARRARAADVVAYTSSASLRAACYRRAKIKPQLPSSPSSASTWAW